MNPTAFVFARSGSKGLPGKNLKTFGGHPLIAWSIVRALEVEKIERVIVSTDSEEIASIAVKYGAEVPFLRPSFLATDESPEWESWKHALESLGEIEGEIPEVMVIVPTVAPLRLSSDIEDCLMEYENGNSDIVITVSKAHRNPYFNMVQQNDAGNFELVAKSDHNVARRQDSPLVYDMSTVCYVANSKFVLSNKSMFDGRVRAIVVPPERALDIDTNLDFIIAERLLEYRNTQ